MKISLNITKFLILIGLLFFISFSASAKGKLYAISSDTKHFKSNNDNIFLSFEKDAITLLLD